MTPTSAGMRSIAEMELSDTRLRLGVRPISRVVAGPSTDVLEEKR